jgi:hypothetical protein
MATPSFELENDAREVYNLIRQAQREASRASDNPGSPELSAEPMGTSALGEPGTAAIRRKSHGSWLPFAVRQSQLVTRLSPRQCYERLQSRLGLDSSSVVTLSGGQVWGDVSADGFRIHCKSREVRNYLVVATGEFTPIPTGTLIGLSFAPDTHSLIFLSAWFGGVILFLCFGVSQFLPQRSHSQPPQWGFVLIPAGMLVMGPVIFMVFRGMAEYPVLQFLKSTLKAEEVNWR